MSVEISVIIPALNEQKYIGTTFDGLKRQTFRDFEVIVVDGGSKDRTAEIARRHARVIISRKRGAGAARNVGAKAAKGRILVFLDADTLPSKNLLHAYSNAMKGSDVAAATGPIYPLEESGPRYAGGYRFVSISFVKLSMSLGRPAFIGSNFAVTKKAFEKAHGFRPDMLSYEDWELSNRLKKFGKMVYCDDAIVKSSVRRVKKWGMSGYMLFYVTNFIKFHLVKESHKDYAPVR